MTEEVEKAESALAAAFKQLGTPTNVNKGQEAKYGVAYQRLVTLGVRPQLRAKYRGAR